MKGLSKKDLERGSLFEQTQSLKNLVATCEKHTFQGCTYNWTIAYSRPNYKINPNPKRRLKHILTKKCWSIDSYERALEINDILAYSVSVIFFFQLWLI